MREFFDAPDGTQEELLAATYRTLRTHGYAALSLQTIGEEFPKSTSLIYHHYDSKDELVLDCLDAMLDQLEQSIATDTEDPHASVATFLEMAHAPVDSPDYQFMRALTEMRGQASHDPIFRERFARGDRVMQAQLTATIEAGAEQGVFETSDPEQAAMRLYTLLTGAIVRRTSTDMTAHLAVIQTTAEELLTTEFSDLQAPPSEQ